MTINQQEWRKMNLQKIGVIGAGIMGTGVSQNLAQTGHEVVLVDVSTKILEESIKNIRQNIRLSMMINPEYRNKNIDEVVAQITPTTNYENLSDVDFIVENVNENWNIKREVYLKIDEICPLDIVFAVNTSAISITKIASLTKRVDKIIGMHFMNPVPLKSTVETIKGFHTSEKTIEISKLFLEGMKKKCILVNDLPGFVSNRISHLFMNEAIWVVQDQVASARAVDEIFKNCFKHEIGPLETADLIGLDTVLDTLKVLYNDYQDPKFRAAPLLRKMVDAGLLGRKSGEGFFKY